MTQPLVLAIEPDFRQAAIVKRIVRENALADVAVVDSLDAAIEAMRTAMPDVLLLSALLSPRDEDDLIAHLKTLGHAGHLQTHTIPQLASALQPGHENGSRGGLLSAFRRKKDPAPIAAGCDPDLFADEIRVFLQRAADRKRELLHPDHETLDMRPSPAGSSPAFHAHAESPAPPSSSWSSPFEWKPSGPSSLVAGPSSHGLESQAPESLVAAPACLAGSGALMAHLTPPDGVARLAQLLQITPEPPGLDAAPTVVGDAPKPQHSRTRDSRSESRDSGLGIRSQRSTVGVAGSGALANWARSEDAGRDAGAGGDELRGLLTGLAVPPAVVAVGYGRGCRIRKVRVPAAREPHDAEAEAAGPVIVSKRVLSGQRDLREQRPA